MAVGTDTLTILDGTSTAKTLAVGLDPAGVMVPAHTLDHYGAAVYRASILYTLGVATPTAVVVAQGSATKIVRFRKIAVQGWSTTAGVMKWKLSRRTTAGTLGSAVLTAIPTQGKNDSGTVASPTLTVSTVGTANYTTLGTLSAILDCGVVGFNLAAQINNTIPWMPTLGASQAFVLRGTSDWLTLDGGADAGGDAVPAGGVALITMEWQEDDS